MIDSTTLPGKIAGAGALAVALTGGCAVAGWAFHPELLKRASDGLGTMNPATAIAFILAGAALAIFLQPPGVQPRKSPALPAAARLFALFVTLIGLANLIHAFGGCDLGVDRCLFGEQLSNEIGLPNRMAPATALSFLLLGSALLCADRKERSFRFCAEFAVSMVGLSGIFTVLAYAFSMQLHSGLEAFIQMPLPTAVAFLVLVLAYLLSHTDSGLLAVFAGDSSGGAMARRLLPVAILAPPLLGWFTLRGEEAGLFHGAFGESVFVIGRIIAFTIVVGWRAKVLFEADLRRQRSQEALRESDERFSGAFVHAPIGVALVSPDGRWLKVNQALCELVGYTEAELLTRTFHEITHPEDIESDLANVRLLIAGKIRSYHMEKRYIHKRGHFVTVLLGVSLVRDGQGRPLYFVSQIQDITEPKRTEAELRWKTAFLEAQASSTIDGVLVVDEHGKKILQNRRVSDLLSIPREIADDPDDERQVRWVTGMVKQPKPFSARVAYLYAHPQETSRDEIELKNGRILDRYSSPVIGQDGHYYGRIWTFRDITGRKRMEESLRESNEKFHQLANNIADAFWIRSPDIREVDYISPAFERIWGRSVEDLYANPGLWAKLILPDDRERVQAAFASLAGEEQSLEIEYRILRPDGEIRWVRVRAFQVHGAADQPIRHTGIVADITDRKRLETQLVQSQKMETVGRLAGGVAHEFNSILTAIIGQSDLLLTDLPSGDPLRQGAAEIRSAADRAAVLTRQLLAYGRKQILRPEILDLGSVLAALEGALRHLMGRGTEVLFARATGLKSVKADIGQIEQVIMNVAMNAADAMPNGGKLSLETANVTLDSDYVRPFPELKAGDYVMLAITDTGTGMSEEVKARIFEPFFSTKGVGEGTGLGLSTCDGIIKQSGGHIAVSSEPGRGATFKIYLPQTEAQAQTRSERPAPAPLPRGTETILLVEEDPSLREMAGALLRRLGYTVLAAADGIEALRLSQLPEAGRLDLLFTDLVIPHMSGSELAERVLAAHPHSSALFTSAFAEDSIVHQGVLTEGVTFLQKPFTPSALARKLREALTRTKAAHL